MKKVAKLLEVSDMEVYEVIIIPYFFNISNIGG